jgi:hypothetical protein
LKVVQCSVYFIEFGFWFSGTLAVAEGFNQVSLLTWLGPAAFMQYRHHPWLMLFTDEHRQRLRTAISS